MSSTCSEPGRRLYIQVWYSVIYIYQYEQSSKQKNVFIEHTLRNINLKHVHFIGLYCIITLQYTVLKT